MPARFACPKGHQWESVADGSSRSDRETVVCPKCGSASLPAQLTVDEPKESSPLPERFGRYQIVKKLGEGGMGAVFLAHDTQLDRRVALKTPQFADTDHSLALERFYREARAAATLNHPNICPVHDVGEIDGVPYLTMAYIEGKLLSRFVNADEPLTQRQIATLVRKVALALHEAHSKGIIHRDLKPANIMVNRRGEPVVMDFGLARRRERSDVRLTRAGAMMGTPAYMPPEQVNGDIDAMGAGSDIYSLGIILYELLAGRLPFEGDMMAMLAQILMDQPKSPAEHRPDVDPALAAICLKALEKKVEDRFASMNEMAKALTEYLRGEAPAVPPPPSPSRSVRQEPRSPAAKSGEPGFRVSQMGGLRSVAQVHKDLMLDGAPPSEVRKKRKRTDKGRRIPPWLWIAGAASAAVALLIGVVILVQTEHGTIRIELSDPNANVEVKVDGTIDVTNLDEPLRLKAGEHGLVVTGKNYETISKSFTVKRGTNPVLRAELHEIAKPAGTAQVTPGPPKEPAPPPPATVAGLPSTPTKATPPPAAVTQPSRESVPLLSSPPDKIQVNSVWIGDTLNLRLTILERRGDTFRGRFTSNRFDREVTGTIKADRIYWLAKDVRPNSGGPGGDNEGTIRGDRIDFVWRDGKGGAGEFSLRLKTSPDPRAQSKPSDRWMRLDADTPDTTSWIWKKNNRADQRNWENGILTLENRAIAFNGIQAKDVSFRAKVKFIEGNNCALIIRGKHGGGGLYALFDRDGGKTLVAFLNTKSSAWLNLKDDFFQMCVTAVGDEATIQVNGATVVRHRTTYLEPGHVSITAFDARGLFKDLEVKILDK